MEPSQDLLTIELQITPATHGYLLAAAKWGKFLAIVGFIICGLVTMMAFFMGPLLATYTRLRSYGYAFMDPMVITALYIFLAIIFFFPCLYLFRFSAKMQDALDNNNQENLDAAFLNLRAIFKFYGVVTIVVLSFYLLIVIINLIATAMGNGQ
jgi:Family of unknown function (DUF5362)